MNHKTLKKIIKDFRNLKVNTIGRSEDDRDIYSISAFFDEKKPWIIIQGGIHGREHLSVDFVVTLAKIIEHKYSIYKAKKNFPNICFVPLVNPDGVEIVVFAAKNIKNQHLRSKVQKIIANNNHKMYKSNANGVDLNNNFDALWNRHMHSETFSMHGFIGEKPFSEKETRALRDLTLEILPIFTISYHLKGEEIYWDFFQKGMTRKRDEKIAKLVAGVNGYAVKSTEETSSGGYKDWCVLELGIPSLTIELGRDQTTHPVPEIEIYDIIAKNIGILDILCDIVEVIKGDNRDGSA